VKIAVHNLKGEVTGDVEVQDSVFDVPFREAVVHQAVVCLLANRRQGTAATKTRSEISGSTSKLYGQKGTGRARRGSVKSPLLRGGGIVFGPSPRSYRQRLPRKMKRLAFKCALSMKMREGGVWVVEDMPAERPRTKDIVALLDSAGQTGSTLIVTPESQPVLALSARNLKGTKVRPCTTLSTLDVMTADKLIDPVSALRKMETIWVREEDNDESA